MFHLKCAQYLAKNSLLTKKLYIHCTQALLPEFNYETNAITSHFVEGGQGHYFSNFYTMANWTLSMHTKKKENPH